MGFAADGQAAVKTDKNNFQPRIGFAFSLTDKTVIRGGYGRYYVNPVGAPGYPNNGFTIQTPFVASSNSNRAPRAISLADPFQQGVLRPAGASQGLESFLGLGFSYSNPNFVVPIVDNFSLGIQRQLPWNIAAEISYVGSRAVCDELLPNPFFGVAGFSGSRFTNATLSRFELSRPFPQFGGISQLEGNEGKAWHNSMQILVNKRLSRGLSVRRTFLQHDADRSRIRLDQQEQCPPIQLPALLAARVQVAVLNASRLGAQAMPCAPLFSRLHIVSRLA